MRGFAAALAAFLYIASPASLTRGPALSTAYSQETYLGSIAAKREVPCVKHATSKYPDNIDFFNKSKDARWELQQIPYGKDLTDRQKYEEYMRLREKYGECVALFSITNPVDERFYATAGREKPPLTGSYEEQAAAAIREGNWGMDFHAADMRRRNAPTYTVQQVKNRIRNLPDSIAADIDITTGGEMRVTGRVLPRFNIKYGERNGTILLSHAQGVQLKGNEERHATWQREYRIIPRTGGPYTMVALERDGAISVGRDGSSWAAHAYSTGALINYINFVDTEGDFRNKERHTIAYNFGNDSYFNEFLKFADRLGTQFDGSARFRKDEYGMRRAGRFLGFRRLGLRSSSGGKELSMGAYFIDISTISINDVIDEAYLREFNNDFNSWLSFNGRRQAIRMTNRTHHGARGPPLPGVRDIEVAGVNRMLIIVEER